MEFSTEYSNVIPLETREPVRTLHHAWTGGALKAPVPFDTSAEAFPGGIGKSAAFLEVQDYVRMVAPTGATVLIEGETGTGKELVARAIHMQSPRRRQAFVTLNCAAIPAGLLESELFGHEKGAFTGAVARRQGRFETADRGTLFLDEIGDMPLELQAKLLRVLQEQEIERLGGTGARPVDVRIVAATNQKLASLVAEQRFRSDLYYRLNVFPISLPPLRDRREDIPLLAGFFVAKFAQRLNKPVPAIAPETMETLQNYPWPGNIRELQNILERAVIMTRGATLQLAALAAGPARPVTMEDAERTFLRKALEETNWVVGGSRGAAVRLGMKRTTLISKMSRMGVKRGSGI